MTLIWSYPVLLHLHVLKIMRDSASRDITIFTISD